jgi:serine/threonine protein kinase/tetratricopeptide (TPR) repeat protein
VGIRAALQVRILKAPNEANMNTDNDGTPTMVGPDFPTAVQRRGRGALAREDGEGLPIYAAEPPLTLPAVGSTFLGFHLRAVLGRGAFGQVYLAEQCDLANRFVALKVARQIFGESQTLAQLQHTNIVPIYSLHRVGLLQAVCMPYFGSTTLADVVEQMRGRTARPASGKALVDSVNLRKQSTAFPTAKTATLTLTPITTTDDPVEPRNAGPLQQLERMSYVDAVLWIGERLADGLAHAHERGIVHRDLKPANILLTEEGQPMLLDFNISEDTKRGDASAVAGGTLPYMSPEHLDSVRDRTRKLDGRTDVYSLGVVLHELLSGTLPFKSATRLTPDAFADMIEERYGPTPPLRRANPDVTPAVASIVHHCLEPDPQRRYQSARELQEDLRRQRSHLPLKHAREASVRERAHKWVRRHPRLTSMTTLGLMLGVFLVALTAILVLRNRQLASLEAQETLRRFRADAKSVQFLLLSRHADRGRLEEGMRQCESALGHFAALDHPHWLDSDTVRRLPAADQLALREEAGEVLFLYARATALHAQAYAEPTDRTRRLEDAQRANSVAAACFGEDRAPRALWEQRADVANLLGDTRAASESAARAKQVPVRTPRDRYLIAHRYAIRGDLRHALELLQSVTRDDPRSFSAWFVRGNCYYDLLQDANAVASYNVCISLEPDFYWSWFNRGLAHLRLRQYRQAVDDFTQVLALRPDLTDAYVSRALALEGMQAYAEAIADYTRALDDPAASTRIWFLRAAARAKAGDRPGARQDYDRGIAAVPTDELGWIALGSVRRERDPKGALADYEQALQLNPRSFDGLQNKAALLSDKFHNDADALAVLDRAVELYPESVLARGGRGVLLARAGKCAAAIEDAQACLQLDGSPSTLYQAGCIYALTAKLNPDDRLQALPLLSAALRAGFGLEFVERDADLDALQKTPELQQIIAAARTLHGNARR